MAGKKSYSIALAIVKRHLTGRQEFATVYSATYHRKPDVMSNVACDWSTHWVYIAHAARVLWIIVKVKKYMYFRMGKTIFKIFIWGGISSYICS